MTLATPRATARSPPSPSPSRQPYLVGGGGAQTPVYLAPASPPPRVEVAGHLQASLISSVPARPARGYSPLPLRNRFIPCGQATQSAENGGRELSAGCAVRNPKVDKPVEKIESGTELFIGSHQLRCIEVLGSGSFSVVWRAEVVSSLNTGGPNSRGATALDEQEVALKDVWCKIDSALKQSIFEAQVLLDVERKALLDGPQNANRLRLPRCFSYRVDPIGDGWSVRTAMTRLPGEQLDDWLRREAIATEEVLRAQVANNQRPRPWTAHLRSGFAMVRRLLSQMGYTLDKLAAVAWHRDVNSHNILVSDSVSVSTPLDVLGSGRRCSFWLCDLGLAVDSPSWGTDDGAWRTADIGGDCRYWPASCWMVHCYGSKFLAGHKDFCRQYRSRLDIHGLGVTGVEVLCSTAGAARDVGAPAPEGKGSEASESWVTLLEVWKRYRDATGQWWEDIYNALSSSGNVDFETVRAQLLREDVAQQVATLTSDLRSALRGCAKVSKPAESEVLLVLAELLDETSKSELKELCSKFDETDEGMPPELVRATADAMQVLESLKPIPACAAASQKGGSTPASAADLRRARERLMQDLERLRTMKAHLEGTRRKHGAGTEQGSAACGSTTNGGQDATLLSDGTIVTGVTRLGNRARAAG